MDILSLLGQTASSSPPLLAALLIGAITSVAPCPLGSNVAAVAFLSRRPQTHAQAAATALSYAAGRGCTYAAIAIAFGIAGAAALHAISPLQTHSDLALALVLAACGLFLLAKLPSFPTICGHEKLAALSANGNLGAFLLGAALALALCPVSAALLFGAVLPLAVSNNDFAFIPLAYGIGTSLPVLAIPQIVQATRKTGAFAKTASALGRDSSRILGAAFMLASAYYALKQFVQL
jgi:cytochrome c biogenesis protein CcdA